MFKGSVAAWILAVMLPASYMGYKSARTGEFFGVPLGASKPSPRPAIGGSPCCDHPRASKLARVEPSVGVGPNDDEVEGPEEPGPSTRPRPIDKLSKQ